MQRVVELPREPCDGVTLLLQCWRDEINVQDLSVRVAVFGRVVDRQKFPVFEYVQHFGCKLFRDVPQMPVFVVCANDFDSVRVVRIGRLGYKPVRGRRVVPSVVWVNVGHAHAVYHAAVGRGHRC